MTRPKTNKNMIEPIKWTQAICGATNFPLNPAGLTLIVEQIQADAKLELQTENKMLADAPVKAAGYLASVRTDRNMKDTEGNEWALQAVDWAKGAVEYADAANAALEAYDAHQNDALTDSAAKTKGTK